MKEIGEPARAPFPRLSHSECPALAASLSPEGSDVDDAAFTEAAIRELSEWMKTAVKISPAA